MAQTHEQERFAVLLRELCDTIPSPAQDNGRPRLPLSDMVFAAVIKVYSTYSVRRAMTNVRLAYADDFLDVAPCYATIMNYLRRPEMTPLLKCLVSATARPFSGIERDFAIDSSGFSTKTYERWLEEKHGSKKDKKKRTRKNKKQDQEQIEKSKAVWVKCHIVCGVKTHTVPWVEIGNRHDSIYFENAVKKVAEDFNIREFSADKAYLSRANFHAVHDVGGTAYIEFKDNSLPAPRNGKNVDGLWQRMFHYYQFKKEEFYQHYHKRSNVETVFSMIKAKFETFVRAKSEVGQMNEVLVKVLCHNLCVLIQSMAEVDAEAEFEAQGIFDKSSKCLITLPE